MIWNYLKMSSILLSNKNIFLKKDVSANTVEVFKENC